MYSEAIFFFNGKIWNGKNYPFANMNILLQFGNVYPLAFARVSSSNKMLHVENFTFANQYLLPFQVFRW